MLNDRPLPAAGAALAAFILALPAAAAAQEQAAPSQVQATAQAPGRDSRAVDVSLERIRRQLREAPPSRASAFSLVKVEYYIDVVAKSPRIDFFKDFNIGRASSVQYGGMTHDEFIKQTQPFWRKW